MAETLAGPARDLTGPVSEIRARVREAFTPACEAVIADTGVTLSDRVIAGVPSMVIDPPRKHGTRKIVYFFGGGFALGSPFEDIPISAALAVQTGAQVIAPIYPLAPENPFPAGLDACTAVARAVLEEDPDTCIVGESAGGNFALATALRLRAEGTLGPRALALLSPAADLGSKGDSFAAKRDPFLIAEDTAFFESNYLPAEVDRRHPDVSPIYGNFNAGFPPVFITTGTRDLFLSICVRLERALREAGVDATLRVWEGMWHVFEFYTQTPEARASLAEIADFLNRHYQSH